MTRPAIILLAILGTACTACTDAQLSKVGALGSQATVRCYSGGRVVYEGESTGKVSSAQGSDGYIFRDKRTRKLTQVSGMCVMTYEGK